MLELWPSTAHSRHSKAVLTPLYSSYQAASAAAVCTVKGSASDYIAQTQVESAAGVDWPRNAAFAAFSGLYLGVGQHLIYNRAFTVLFGSGQDLRTGLKKVLADSLVHVPLIYLPLYYPFKSVVLGEGSFLDGLARYRADARDVLTTYWSIWPALHLVNFTLTPPELRISLVAAVSFGWLVYLSWRSHADEEVSGSEEHTTAALHPGSKPL